MAGSQSVGRYVLYDQIASGGMATVHLGRLIGPVGFSRVVAVKRLHPIYANDPEFVTMLLDEARFASRIRHPNVVPILDVVASDAELLLVMEYVHGETLARLLRAGSKAGERMPPEVGAAVVIDILRGLHAAHEAPDAAGHPLGIVHRDVSPQNILVATDGSARLLDFGVAKAASRSQNTADGQLKGKLGYFAPEQIAGGEVDRRVDIFAASIVAWECIAGRRLFTADDMIATFAQIVDAEVPSLRGAGYQISEALSRTIQRGLEKNPADRFQTAEEMAREIEAALRPASREAVRAWVEKLAGPTLAARLKVMQRIETGDVDATVAQVPVDISPDQSGKLPTLRAALAATPGDDGGTFPATLATLSIASAVPRGRGWRIAAALALVVVVFGAGGAFALLSRSVTNERQAGTPLAEVTPPPAAQPAATVALPAAATTAEPASSAVEVDAGAPVAATALELSPPPATRSTRPVSAAAPKKPGSAASGVAAPSPPPPVDPLSDQR